MKHAAPVRRELATRTVFNVLGPLTNPAGARALMLGVYSPALTRTLADALVQLGATRAYVVHGAGGIDELSPAGPNLVCEVENGTVREYELDLPQSLTLPHITHCLDSLRTDILCYADDMPRYTTATKSPESAVGQPRVCRDWSKLEEWAELHTSCYHYISHKADFINQFGRFKYCPKDSPYWPALREHWNKPDDWFGEGCTHGELGVEC